MSQSESTGIPLSGSVGVAQVAELYATVTEACATEPVIAFDCSETRDIDASIVQLLLASQAAAEEKGSKMEIRGASETLAKLLEEYGLGESLSHGDANDEASATEKTDAEVSSPAEQNNAPEPSSTPEQSDATEGAEK